MTDVPHDFPRFIVGMPRAGTTWLCQCLNQHPDVAAFGETMFWGRSFVAPDQSGVYNRASKQAAMQRLLAKPLETTIFIAGSGMMSEDGARDIKATIQSSLEGCADGVAPGHLFARIADRIARAEGKKIWIEKTPHHIYHFRRILKFLPAAKFVVTVRDPYSFAQSYKHEPGFLRAGQRVRHSAIRFHPIMPAIVWRRCWRSTLKAMHERPDRILVVRQEDIKSDPLGVLRRVETFLMLSHNAAVQGVWDEVNSSFAATPRPRIHDAEIAWMNLIAGNRIGAAGYKRKTASLAPRDWLISLVSLLPWGFLLLKAKAFHRTKALQGTER